MLEQPKIIIKKIKNRKQDNWLKDQNQDVNCNSSIFFYLQTLTKLHSLRVHSNAKLNEFRGNWQHKMMQTLYILTNNLIID